MNRREVLAIVLGSVMLLGVVGGGFTAAATATVGDDSAETSASGPAVVQDDEGNESDEGDQGTDEEGQDNETETDGQENGTDRIPITEAMQAAQEETEDRNATVVGAELGQRGGLLDFAEDDESVYTVDALLANGTHIEVAVNATNGSVVESSEQGEGFLEGVFGGGEVPQEPLDLGAMYNATEAVELAQNGTGENGTVTSVSLDRRDDGLVYRVEMDRESGEATVVVDAMREGQGVIEVDEDVGVAAGNETEEGDGDGMGEGNDTGEGDDGGM